MKRRSVAFTEILGIVVCVLIWEGLARTGLIDRRLFPGAIETFASLKAAIADGTIPTDLLVTLCRSALAFSLAVVLGVPLGMLLGMSPKVYRMVSFPIDFFRSTPAAAIIPLFIVIFGLGDLTKIAVAGFGAWLIILFHTAHGVINAPQFRRTVAATLGASKVRIFRDVVMFESLPSIIVGLRLAVSLTLVLVVIGEMFIGGTDGLGHAIIDAQLTFDMPRMYAAIVVTGILGYISNALFVCVERQFVHWAGK